MIILYVIGVLFVLYMLCGAVLMAAATYYMVGTQEKYPKHANIVNMYKEATPKAKAHMWACGLWYCLICWLPIALGYMEKPSEFLNERKK